MVIGPEEDSSAEAVLKILMASRLIINSKAVQVTLLEAFLYHTSSLFDIEQCYSASLKTGWRERKC